MKKRIIPILLVAMLCLGTVLVPQVSIADESGIIITPFYTIISSIHGTCYIENGLVVVSGTVNSAGNATYAKVTVVLEKNSGSGWVTEKEWSKVGVSKATLQETRSAASGVLYRATITGYVSNDSGSESDSFRTRAVTL